MQKRALLILLFLLPSCLQAEKPTGAAEPRPFENPYATKKSSSSHGLEAGQVIIQGILGAAKFEDIDRSGGDNPDLPGTATGLSQMPLIGGNWQIVMGGDRIDYGVEAGGSFGFRSDGGAVRVGGGGAAIAVKIDMFLLDFYGGPFASIALGEKIRVYGAVGPLMQFVNYQQKSDQDGFNFNNTGTGFGLGWYSRLGAEIAISRSMMVGVGARWIDSNVNLSGALGDIDVRGTQMFLTFSTGF